MTNADLLGFWNDFGALVLLGAGLAGLIALAGLLVWARKSKKSLRPIALAVSMNLALLLNAEGMWVIATDPEGLDLPKLFAVLVFAVFEICFLTATSLAAEQYRRTTTYAPDGSVVSPGHPGSMLYVAALIAGLSGLVVASFADSGTERLLRLAIPAVIFLMWWAALTAAGQRLRRSRFAYSPRRLAERWGWLIPDEDPDLIAMAAARQVRRMVVNHQRVSAGRFPAVWWRSRLQKDARTATDAVVAEVVAQLARIDAVMALLGDAPGGTQRRTEPDSEPVIRPAVPQSRAASQRSARVRHRALRRHVCLTHPRPVVVAAPEPNPDPRETHEVDLVVRVIKQADPKMPQRQIARLARTSEPTVRRALRRTQSSEPTQPVNGKKPDLEPAGT